MPKPKAKLLYRAASSPEEKVAASLREAIAGADRADNFAEMAHMALSNARQILESLRTRGGLNEEGKRAEEDLSELLRALGSVRQELGDVVWKAQKYAKKLG